MSEQQETPAPQPVKRTTSRAAPRKYCAVANCGRRPETDSDRCIHHRVRVKKGSRR